MPQIFCVILNFLMNFKFEKVKNFRICDRPLLSRYEGFWAWLCKPFLKIQLQFRGAKFFFRANFRFFERLWLFLAKALCYIFRGLWSVFYLCIVGNSLWAYLSMKITLKDGKIFDVSRTDHRFLLILNSKLDRTYVFLCVKDLNSFYFLEYVFHLSVQSFSGWSRWFGMWNFKGFGEFVKSF